MKKLAWMVPALIAGLVVTGCNMTKTQNTVQQKPVSVEADPDNIGNMETQKIPGVTVNTWVPAREKPIPAVAQTTPYTVAKGDTLSSIAQQYNLRWQDIAAANPGVDANKLRVNQTIFLPGVVDVTNKRPASAPRAVTTPVKIAAPAPAVAASDNVYVVKKGDTLGHIAVAHKVKVADLKSVNNLKSDKINEGQKLKLPANANVKVGGTTTKVEGPKSVKSPGPAPTPVEKEPVVVPPVQPVDKEKDTLVAPPVLPVDPENAAAARTHTVVANEDIFSIALKYGISPSELRETNNINVNNVAVGTVLKIPPPTVPAP